MRTPLASAFIRPLAVPVALALFAMSSVFAQSNPLGDFEAQADVGAPKIAGRADYDPSEQEYTLTAGGANMWAGRDEFHFVWRRLGGDFLVRTRARFVDATGNPHRKCGLIMRTSLEPDSTYVDGAVHADGLASLQNRREKGGATRQFVLPIERPDVLQLERRGRRLIFSAARYGEPFTSTEISDLNLGDTVYVGLFVCAHDPAATVTAVFRDVRIVRPAKPDFRPYRDYIGSVLELLDVTTGRLRKIYQAEEPFEAPNWTPDGKALIYNVSGSGPRKGVLDRFDLATRKPTPIDTGVAVHNNNDHVISFDGTRLGISNQGPETHGQSAVWVVPINGGTPRQVTALTPSYFHGWSRDDQWLVYTGGRPEKPGGPNVFSIYKIPTDGGPEIRLTRGEWLDDGPEFTPDGKYIYFNSTRTGRMQIWRMRPDGSGQEQVTSDEFNNWFPHISPDGKWIAFVSYLPDVPASEHPYYKKVYLRLMSADGMGPARVIAYVYGGQGTMNVPSWSPDSRRIAFVANSDGGQ
ncbi:MAG TPA: biopolymer transporter TolR [Opitutaceae bacterium]|nr:biopolymer transporter TolR [Opitutaceae bacterium]